MVQLLEEEHLKKFESVQWAPMVDFLFIVITVFATIAITRNVTVDREVHLAKSKQNKQITNTTYPQLRNQIHLSINHLGKYKWRLQGEERTLDTPQEVEEQLKQVSKHVTVLLHIDRSAPWQPIADIIFAVRAAGLEVHPVYRGAH